ncbi:hypothetical protein [uncultured Aquimarina sp.]|uniref:hypothetical protein n=1 Tax=uncultured Aquimarina sp. TaxID=575652 RepID=UPI00262F70B9|nr:hypothetical protein [uncultured Aquimarina sp.]
MKKSLKNILIFINLVILVLAAFWFYSNKGYEPAIVFVGQLSSLVILAVEGRTKSTDIEGVEKSKIRIKSKVIDDTLISVKNVKDDSEIDVTRD